MGTWDPRCRLTDLAHRRQIHLGDDEPVLVRRRLLLIDDEPAQIADSYYPHRLVEGTIAGSEPVTAGLLRLRPGVPVLRILQALYDTSGTAVCVTDNILAGDRHAFLFETVIVRPSSTQDAGSG